MFPLPMNPNFPPLLPPTAPLPSELIEVSKKIELMQKGIPLDWLVRAQNASRLEEIVHLFHLHEQWAHEDLTIIHKMLIEYGNRGGQIIEENNPEKISRGGTDPPLVSRFTRRLLELAANEETVMDSSRDSKEAWARISMKLGGWATIRNMSELRIIYFRRRSQWRSVKGTDKEERYQYLREMKEIDNRSEKPIKLKDYMNLYCHGMEYEKEIIHAPEATQQLLRKFEKMIETIRETKGDAALADFLSKCCTDVAKSRENVALAVIGQKCGSCESL